MFLQPGMQESSGRKFPIVVMRAPDILVLRWFLLHLSRFLLRLNRRLLEFTLRVARTRRDYLLAQVLTWLSVRFGALNSRLTHTLIRLRRHWEDDL